MTMTTMVSDDLQTSARHDITLTLSWREYYVNDSSVRLSSAATKHTAQHCPVYTDMPSTIVPMPGDAQQLNTKRPDTMFHVHHNAPGLLKTKHLGTFRTMKKNGFGLSELVMFECIVRRSPPPSSSNPYKIKVLTILIR